MTALINDYRVLAARLDALATSAVGMRQERLEYLADAARDLHELRTLKGLYRTWTFRGCAWEWEDSAVQKVADDYRRSVRNSLTDAAVVRWPMQVLA